MAPIIIDANSLNLPEPFAAKLRGKKLEAVETAEGILLRPLRSVVDESRGILRGTGYTTEEYFKAKTEEKRLER